MIARGPEYADQLTPAERRTLDVLVAEVDRRNAGTRPARRTPIAAGLGALVIFLAVALVAQLGGSEPPARSSVASGTPPARSAAAVFQDLAAAAAAVPKPAVERVKDAYRRRLDVVVSAVDGRPGYCRVAAVTIETWEPVEYLYLSATDGLEPHTALLAAERTDPPAAAVADCAALILAEPAVPVPFEAELVDGWEKLSHALGAQAPRYAPLRIVEHNPTANIAPRAINEFVGPADSPHRWWLELAQLLASPQPDPSTIVAALELAADRAAEAPVGTVEALGRAADVTGRPGVTLRVPYALDDQLTTAELTFDPDTGALLQLAVSTDARTEITAFLAIEMQ